MASFQDYQGRLQRAFKKFMRLRVRKMHLDYIAGILSIPVLISAVIINWGNLTKTNTAQNNPTPTPEVIIVNQDTPKQVAPTSAVCKKTVGPISISSPQEGDTISDNPVCITINYSDQNYCSVVWSYKINNGAWSDYNNNSPCLYNLPNGKVQFQLRVNSTVSQDTKTLTRNFTYTGSPVSTPTLAATPTTASSSATAQ